MSEPVQEVKKEGKQIVASLHIFLVQDGSAANIEVSNDRMNPYMIPTLLRQLAKNYEEAVLETKSLI